MAILGSTTVYGALSVTDNVSVTGTVTGSKVYNAVFNDYAELFKKDDSSKDYKPGYIIELNPKTNKYRYSTSKKSKYLVGVVSDSYGHLVGGDEGKTMVENLKTYIPVGLCGRVDVFIKGKVKIGDLITSSDIEGVGVVSKFCRPGTIIGKALEDKNTTGIDKVKILILNR